VANNREYLARLRAATQAPRECRAVHRQILPVEEVFRGRAVWRGEVEVFGLNGHPKSAKLLRLNPPARDQESGALPCWNCRQSQTPQSVVKAAVPTEVKR